MLGYYFVLALRSMRQTIVLTTLMIIAVAVGIGTSMTMLTIFRAASGDPIPQKSGQLFVPQIDNFGPQYELPQNPDFPPPDLTYTDAIALMRAHAAVRQAADARRDSYRGGRGVAVIMGVVSAILLGVTAFGIVGLTSYWVAQRRRQIGIRRAFGGTRGAILRYFHTENLLIAAGGSIVGVGLALAANLWTLQSIALARLPPVYPLIGVVAMLLLGQLSVLWPALRAASMPPALVARNI